MSTDLESELRDALQARAATITSDRLRRPTTPARRRYRPAPWALAAAALVVALIGVGLALVLPGGGGDRTPLGHSTAPLLAGRQWRIAAVTENGTRQVIASSDVFATFHVTQKFEGSDGVNYYGGKWRQNGSELFVTDATSTLVGYAGHDPAVLAAQNAMVALTRGQALTVSQHGDGIRLEGGSMTLELVPSLDPGFDGAGATPSSADSSTPSPTGHPSHSYVNGSELAPEPSAS